MVISAFMGMVKLLKMGKREIFQWSKAYFLQESCENYNGGKILMFLLGWVANLNPYYWDSNAF